MTTGTRVSNVVPQDAYREFKQLGVRLDSQCAEWLAKLAASITADDVLAWYRELYWYNLRFGEIAAVPGILDYAIVQEDDPTYDLAAEFGVLITAVVAAYSYIYTTIPRDPNGFVLTHTLSVDGDLVPAVYTAAIPEVAAIGPYLTAIAAALV